MQIPLFQVDAFSDKTFGGNPAAVCVLNEWLSDEVLQAIAEENNLSETAFLVGQQGQYELRWFTPEAEVDLCGHDTLAASHGLFKHLSEQADSLRFQSRSGELTVRQIKAGYALDFPTQPSVAVTNEHPVLTMLGVSTGKVLVGADIMVVLNSQQEVQDLSPDFTAMKMLEQRGVIVTAPGEECDFVSRCFFPKLRIDEDPVTGSAHCQMAPYWAKTLGKRTLSAIQVSNRRGYLTCVVEGNRVQLTGQAADYLQGIITL